MPVTVYLVGAGPGDPGLLTLRAKEVLSRADAIVYDYLAAPELLAHAREDAKLIYAGKKGYASHYTQQEVNELLVETARSVEADGGECVVRLKGGDPFVFGRGGEEALALIGEGIAFEIVPGVTSGIAAPAYAGIPVTHRGMSSSVTFVTGNEDPLKRGSSLDWNALARMVKAGGTLCVYMGMRNLQTITRQLMAEGLDAGEKVALVQRGATSAQRALVTTLNNAARDAAESGIGAPAIIVVGPVVALREILAWHEKKPLFGKRLVITRASAQANSLRERLESRGAEAVVIPTIKVAPLEECALLDEAMSSIQQYDWILFTSVNGVEAFFSRLEGDARALARALVAAIGPATARRLRDFGIVADTVPREYRSEAVFEAVRRTCDERGIELAGANVLIPRAKEARDVLPDLLREAGACVTVAPSYKTELPAEAERHASRLIAEMNDGRIDGITFTSSSTARNLMKMLGPDGGRLLETRLYSIGPITSETLRQLGFHDIVEARSYTIEGLVDAIVRDCQRRP